MTNWPWQKQTPARVGEKRVEGRSRLFRRYNMIVAITVFVVENFINLVKQ